MINHDFMLCPDYSIKTLFTLSHESKALAGTVAKCSGQIFTTGEYEPTDEDWIDDEDDREEEWNDF